MEKQDILQQKFILTETVFQQQNLIPSCRLKGQLWVCPSQLLFTSVQVILGNPTFLLSA